MAFFLSGFIDSFLAQFFQAFDQFVNWCPILFTSPASFLCWLLRRLVDLTSLLAILLVSHTVSKSVIQPLKHRLDTLVLRYFVKYITETWKLT
jgi:hypothetical protein